MNMANIDHYHGDEMRHMSLPQGVPFWYAVSHIVPYTIMHLMTA